MNSAACVQFRQLIGEHMHNNSSRAKSCLLFLVLAKNSHLDLRIHESNHLLTVMLIICIIAVPVIWLSLDNMLNILQIFKIYITYICLYASELFYQKWQIFSYSIETEASHPPLCPHSWPGAPAGDGHIFDSPVAVQAAPVYFLPVGMNKMAGVNQTVTNIQGQMLDCFLLQFRVFSSFARSM